MKDLREELRRAVPCQVRPGETGSDITDQVNAAKTLWLMK